MSKNCRTAHNTRILLIDCSRPLEKSKRTRYDVHQPPVGLLSIATAAWKAEVGGKLDITILDSTVDYHTLDEVKARIRDFRPHILGLRCLHFHTSQFHELSRYAKVVCKVPLVIAGGPYVTAEGPRVMQSDQFLDLVAIGEGEATFVDIVTAFQSDGAITGIPGTLYRNNGDVAYGPPRALVADLDDLPIPDWSVIDFSKYSTILTQAPVLRKCAPVMTSRGCPYSCTYCHKLFQKKTRLRSPEHVVDELQLLKSMGVNDISIIDDIFNIDGQRVREIFDLVSKRNLGQRFYYANGLRADLLPDDVIDAMVDGGSVLFTLALESANQRVQRLCKKNLNLERTRRAMQHIISRGAMLDVFCMIGFPTETMEEALETKDFVAAFDEICFAYLNVVNVFPGTEMYDSFAPQLGLSSEVSGYEGGYHGKGSDENLVTQVRLAFLVDFFLTKRHINKALEIQKKFLTEKEIVTKYESYMGRSFHSIDDVQSKLAIY
jgi:anaerobic magnesium-protoporphyrin IX monomethyl ester cyclase